MSYSEWNGRCEVLQFAPWYSVKDLVCAVNASRKCNFSIAEQRSQVLERFGSLVNTCPFSEGVRFPAKGLYVCEMLGDWPRKFAQLRLSLGHKDHIKDQGVRAGVELSISLSDPSVSFSNSLTSMYEQLLRNDSVYSRVAFEEENALSWRNASEPESAPSGSMASAE